MLFAIATLFLHLVWGWCCFWGPAAFSDFMPTVLLSAAKTPPEPCTMHPSSRRNWREIALLPSQHGCSPEARLFALGIQRGLFVSFLARLWVFNAVVKTCILLPPILSQFQIPNVEFLSEVFSEWFSKAPRMFWIIRIHQTQAVVKMPVCLLWAGLILGHLWSFLFYSTQNQENVSWEQWNMPWHISPEHIYISAWKSPLSVLRIYLVKVAISQVPCNYCWFDFWDNTHLNSVEDYQCTLLLIRVELYLDIITDVYECMFS